MSTTQMVPLLSGSEVRVSPRAAALALPAILLLAAGLRIGAFWTQTYVLFFDETLQYFEQGHRVAFGSGVIPWEFHDGIRSWLLPGLIACVMRAAAWFGDDPLLAIRAVRGLCVMASLVVVAVGFRAGRRHFGLAGAILTGGFCAIWFDLIYFSSAAMTEVLAAHCAVLALWLGETDRTRRKLYWIGALFGLALCLRYQYGPVLAIAAAYQYRLKANDWTWLFLGGASMLLPFAGVLDAVTWGTPFQSIWMNFQRNSLDGIAASIGTEPSTYFLSYLNVAFLPLPFFLLLAAIGARRFPALALAALATVAMHSLVPHKEVRFIYLALAAAPILIGLGAARVLDWLATRHGPRALTAGVPLFLAVAVCLSVFIGTGLLGPRWSFQRGTVHAFLAAHEAPGLCGLQVRDMAPWKSGGYAYLNRDVPLVFDPPVYEVHLTGVSIPLRFSVERAGAPVLQQRSPISHAIAEAGHAPDGFAPMACFPGDASPNEPELCLFRRVAGCSRPG